MGFFSWKCCVSGHSIPSKYCDFNPALSRVTVVLPNDAIYSGIYDGYGRIDLNDQNGQFDFWGFLLQYSETMQDAMAKVKLVRQDFYHGQKYADLPVSENCPAQGYFYDRSTINRLIKSLIKKSIVRHYYADPQHGWLKVPLQDLIKYKLLDSISSCSYIKGIYAYLECDCDFSRYVDALSSQGIKLILKEHHTNKQSKIRSYDRYQKPLFETDL